MKEFMMILSGICWSIVYIELIRGGFKYKTYVMPLFALGLNLAWELLYSVDDLLLGAASVQGWVNLVWAGLDLIIAYTYLKYGKKYFPEKAQKYFIPFSILVFVTCFIFQFAFYFNFNSILASQYSAFVQNAAMSIMFVVMLFQRDSTGGQSMIMAFAKCIGTLVPSILGGFLESFNSFIILTGLICLVFDIIYIVLLSQMKRKESNIQQSKISRTSN